MILSLPFLGLYYGWHEQFGIDGKDIIFTASLEKPLDYIVMVIMLTLIAIYAPEGKKATWFALMASFMNLASTGGKLISKYLNKVFEVTKAVEYNGNVVTPADYSELGYLIWAVMILGFVIPTITIVKFKSKLKPQLTT
ncbi:MAG: hypothetical protein U9N49_08240 [Campylobacterota bacterium]|nr:hypothetical protein [Campylobacterota bacterium]